MHVTVPHGFIIIFEAFSACVSAPAAAETRLLWGMWFFSSDATALPKSCLKLRKLHGSKLELASPRPMHPAIPDEDQMQYVFRAT